MPTGPQDERDKAHRGTFERKEEEELEEEEELDEDFSFGVANSDMEQVAEASRLKTNAKKLSAEALAEMIQPWGVTRFISGGDDEDEGKPKNKNEPADAGDDGDGSLGSLDAPLWHGILAAPAPPARPAGFPRGSKWVRPS